MRHDLFAFSLNIWDIDSNYFTGGIKRVHEIEKRRKLYTQHWAIILSFPGIMHHLTLNYLEKIIFS